MIIVVVLGIAGVSTYIWYLKSQLDKARADAALSQALYQENIQELETLKEQRHKEQIILLERETRMKEALQSSEKRISEILKHDSSKDCPVSPAINNLLNSIDGMSGPKSQDTDGKASPAP